MSFSITTEVVDFLLRRDPIPADVKNKAIMHVIDGIAVMLAGSRMECAQKLAGLIREKGGKSASTLVGFDFKSTQSDAALVNGTSGHADDYDDTQLSTSTDRIYGLLTHPTVPVLAAALAVGEKLVCTGKELLEAFIMGFEVECKLAETIKPEHYKRGFHTTGTIGAFGATSASSRLLGLDAEEMRHAIGITASMSSGIRANFGTMTKPLHAGMAASNGVVACMLSKRGYSADRNSLDGKWGFFNILGFGSDPEKIKDKLGSPYTIVHPGASIKMYPCGSLAQPSMDALLEIVSEKGFDAKDVREIRLRAGPNILEPLRYKRPTNALQAKFSLQFGLASILVKRRAGLREYTTEFVNTQEIREAIKKVKTIYDSEVASMGTDKMRSIVEVELQDRQVLRRVADTARGTPEKPLNEGELYDKFRECATFVVNEPKIEQIWKTVKNIEGLYDIRQLTSLLTR